MIRSITLTHSRAEFLAACVSGNVYRCLSADLTHTTATMSHISSISCIAFPGNSNNGPEGANIFVTATRSGELRVWDITDYSCLSITKLPKSGAVLCLSVVDSSTIISGWEDGSVKCMDSRGSVRWEIAHAHRDGTTSIAVHLDPTLQYFASGGRDGAVRVSSLK